MDYMYVYADEISRSLDEISPYPLQLNHYGRVTYLCIYNMHNLRHYLNQWEHIYVIVFMQERIEWMNSKLSFVEWYPSFFGLNVSVYRQVFR